MRLPMATQSSVVTPKAIEGPDVVVSLQNVSKSYFLWNRPQDRLKHALFGRFGRTYGREFWALRDVSFEVRAGEAVWSRGQERLGKEHPAADHHGYRHTDPGPVGRQRPRRVFARAGKRVQPRVYGQGKRLRKRKHSRNTRRRDAGPVRRGCGVCRYRRLHGSAGARLFERHGHASRVRGAGHREQGHPYCRRGPRRRR